MNNSFFSRIPPVTKNLIIINFIVWLAMFALPKHLGANLEDLLGLHYFKSPDFNPVQLFTYMFLHSRYDLAHIFFNMFTLFMLGGLLERTLGAGRFLFYYLSCGIGAALIQEAVWAMTWESSFVSLIASQNVGVSTEEIEMWMTSPQGAQIASAYLSKFLTIGASGAIYGVLLAFGVMFPNMPMYLMFIPIPIKAKWMVIGMGIIELLIGLSQAAGANDGVAHFAHLGGMIFGLLILLYWKKKGLLDGLGY
ncbi:MAG: rhomboid family intramembrane serine protease [Lachnoclostridium sp.]|nr:rhomboid family intramembrane serine protease [Lachnoclostridium sp.]